MPFLQSSDASIYYEIHGHQGTWVTLINGHTRSSSDFRMMARLLVETEQFRVLMIDNRASGKSEVHTSFTLNDMCRDVVRIWDTIQIPKSAVLGISMGGLISLGLAIQWPERVSNLILVSTAPEESYIRSTGGAWVAEGNQLEEKMRSYFAPGFVERNPVLFSTMLQQIRQAINNGKFSKLSEMQRDAIRGARWTERLHEITASTLVVHGEQDKVVELSGARVMAHEIKTSKLFTLPGVGHLLLAEAPKDLYRIVIDFLKES